MVWFYQERKGIVLFTIPHWFEKPICRPTPYDIAIKYGQHRRPKRYLPTGDFLFRYPEPKKPFCFRWWHGEASYQKGDIDEGRDWCFLFDYCQLGDSCPDCHLCKTIDSIERLKNHYFKFYSEQTESRKAYPLRGEYHAPCGSYWMFESKDRPDVSYISEVYTEGMGFWTIQGSIIQDDIEYYKGHLRHSPDGTMEGHSATPDDDDSAGSRWKVYSPDNTTADSYGLIAAELINLETGAVVRIYKDGSIRVRSTAQGDKSEVWLEKTGHCWIWNIVANAYVEIFANGDMDIKSPTEINITAPAVNINGALNITGSCNKQYVLP